MNQDVLFRSDSPIHLEGYTDTDWADCPDLRRSITEAEYRAKSAASSEIFCLRRLLSKLGILPPNIGSILPNIEELYLSVLTNLVGTIPPSISNCSKLTILDLSYNKLTGLIPNSFGYLTHIQRLSLGGNNLTSDSSLSFLTSLTNCRNLKFLSLSFNPLNDMLPAYTGNLSTSLRTFYANSCNIRGRIPNEVGNLSSLLKLDLSRNNMVGSIPTST
ncbi:hypothetical protein T459_11191 [Capsicum annuum]|uniref:Uncharacterized protein n=1 Tax=Capsicum annuum TaxID=4072 RepID=A0A2G2ZL68_CAPAN|nr:hypothetical protein T459_11191 [Capsicum annuum]